MAQKRVNLRKQALEEWLEHAREERAGDDYPQTNAASTLLEEVARTGLGIHLSGREHRHMGQE